MALRWMRKYICFGFSYLVGMVVLFLRTYAMWSFVLHTLNTPPYLILIRKSRKCIFSCSQDRLCNLRGSVKNENEGLLVQKVLRALASLAQ